MKKHLSALILAIVSVLVFATGASAYIVGWLSQPFEVREPISIKVLQAPASPMWPGSIFSIDYEITNQADVAYGMSYGGYITYMDVSGKTLRFQLEKQPTKDKEPNMRLLQKPEETLVGVFPKEWGQISFQLTINGVQRTYTPYEVVNIDAKARHLLTAKIKPSAELPPGKWEFVLSTDRGEPNPIGDRG